MSEICNKNNNAQMYVKLWTQYAKICKTMHENMLKYVSNMHLYAKMFRNMQKNMQTYVQKNM